MEGPVDRNARLVDVWSLVHVVASAALTLLVGPFWALVVVTLWEPFEVLLLSPWLRRRGVVFGHEALRNSLSDVAFNVAGVLLATYGVLPAWNPLDVSVTILPQP